MADRPSMKQSRSYGAAATAANSWRDDSGLIAEFSSPGALVRAAGVLRDLGYRELDALTPRPIEALDEVLGLTRSDLPRSVFIAGLCGIATALGVQWYCNALDYPINVGGRPPFSLPAFIPITFEIMVLFAALTAFFGVLRRMRLPRLAHPVFAAPGIEAASIDRFFLVVSERDPQFNPEQAAHALRALSPEQIVRFPSGEPVEPPPAAPAEPNP